MPTSKKNSIPINDKIRSEKVLLINSNGEKKGIVTLSQALEGGFIELIKVVLGAKEVPDLDSLL